MNPPILNFSVAMVGIFAAVGSVVLGAWMLKRGRWPRRVGDTPHCPRCNYNLTGIEADRCPECGGRIWPGNIILGERHRRGGLAAAGLLLVAVPMLLFFGNSIGRLQEIEWYHFRPAAWVLQDLDQSSPATQSRAWTELQRRMAAGNLSAAKQNALIERALTQQQAQNGLPALTNEMMDFLGRQYLAHKLLSAQADRFFAGAMKFKLEVRSMVGIGDCVPYRISSIGHGPPSGWWMRYVQHNFIDGREDLGSAGGAGGFSGWSTGSMANPQAPGAHRLHVTVDVGAGNGNSPRMIGPLDHSRTIDLITDFQVIPARVSLPLDNSTPATAVRRCLSAEQFSLSSTSSGRESLYGNIQATNPPTDLAFDVIAPLNGREYSLGSINFCKSLSLTASTSTFGIGCQNLPPGDFQKIDIILRGSEKAAKTTVDMTQFWQGEVIIRDVPVKRSQTAVN